MNELAYAFPLHQRLLFRGGENVFKKITIIVVALAMGAPLAHAQAELLIGLVANKLLADGQRKEFSAGKIVFNVYVRRGRDLKMIAGWDSSIPKAIAWPDGAILEPVVIINGSNSPREIQWAMSSAKGPLVKFMYNPVKGGKRGKNGEAVDNAGYVYDNPLIYLKDLEKGFIAIHASWGKGEAAVAQFMHFDVNEAVLMYGDDDVRHALAGAGDATSPALPLFSAVMPDGTVRNFVSLEEMKLSLNGAQRSPKADQSLPPKKEEAQEGPKPLVPKTAPAMEIRLGRYERKVFVGRDKGEMYRELAEGLTNQAPAELTDEAFPIPDGQGLAVLVISPEKFSARLENSKTGKLIQELKPIWSEQDKTWALFVPVIYVGNSSDGATLVFATESQKREVKFSRGER